MNSKSAGIFGWRRSSQSKSDRIPCQSVQAYFLRTTPTPRPCTPRTYVIYDENTADEALEPQLDLHPNTANGGFAASIFRELSDATSTECVHPTLNPDDAVSEPFTFETSQGTGNIESLAVSTVGPVPESPPIPERHIVSGELATVICDYDSLWVTSSTSPESQGRATVQPKERRELYFPPQDSPLSRAVSTSININSQNGLDKTSSYKLLVRRAAPDDGTLIIIIDVVVLFILLIAALGIILCIAVQRRKKRRREDVAMQELSSGATDLEAARETVEADTQNHRTSIEPAMTSLEHRITLSSFEELSVPTPTPPLTRSATPKLSLRLMTPSPLGDVLGALGNLQVPNSYGDPYANWPGQDAPGSEAHSTLSRKSSSASAHILGSFARLSTRSFDEPALSDTRSGVLSRNQSTKSTAMLSRNFSNSSSSTSKTDRPPRPPAPALARTPRTLDVRSEFPSTLRPLYREPDSPEPNTSM